MPKKPAPSSLLTKGEYKSIMEIHSSLFEDPLKAYNHYDWVNLILSRDRDKILNSVHKIYEQRTEFKQKFSSLTTSRLNMIRKKHNQPDLRKASVNVSMLTEALALRDSPHIGLSGKSY